MADLAVQLDQLSLAGDKVFTKILDPDESLIVSCKVLKYNKRNKAQERNFVLTNKAVYNLKGKKNQRKIGLDSVAGVTYSSTSDEFVMHCPIEYDYRFACTVKKAVIDNMGVQYEALTGGRSMLLQWEVEDLTLKEFTTTKTDKKKGLNRMPRKDLAKNFSPMPRAGGPSQEESKGEKGRSRTIFAHGQPGQEIGIEHFEVLKVLGRGTFGKVSLVKKRDTGEMFAMKQLRKDALLEKGQVEHTRTEKMIMQHINHPFMCNLMFAFTTTDRIYFVMQFMRGGELFFHLKENRKFPEPQTRFYAAQIFLALEHLHEQNIVYRDLKPENILMDDYGNVCMTDFGMAKQLSEEGYTMSFVGTPEYLAPEIISCRGHGKTADWWSFGILVFEMLVGIPPFYNENVQLMYELIQHGEIRFPKMNPLSDQARDFITKLLNRNPAERLGAGGSREVKDHAFFAEINWEALLAKELTPPFKPTIEGELGIGNFDKEFTDEAITDTPCDASAMQRIQANQDQFTDF